MMPLNYCFGAFSLSDINKRDGHLESSPKLNPKQLDCILVVDWSIIHKPLLLTYFRLDLRQPKNSKFMEKNNLCHLGGYYHADVSVDFSHECCFN